jgi:hypothetical protein
MPISDRVARRALRLSLCGGLVLMALVGGIAAGAIVDLNGSDDLSRLTLHRVWIPPKGNRWGHGATRRSLRRGGGQRGWIAHHWYDQQAIAGAVNCVEGPIGDTTLDKYNRLAIQKIIIDKNGMLPRPLSVFRNVVVPGDIIGPPLRGLSPRQVVFSLKVNPLRSLPGGWDTSPVSWENATSSAGCFPELTAAT